MQVIKNIKPGADGTKRYVRRFGDRLLCVRYRLDKPNGKRLTTVELIVDQVDYRPKTETAKRLFPSANRNVYLRIEYDEKDLQSKVRQAGAKWLKDKKRWKMVYHKAINLGLKNRIEEVDE